MKKSTKACRQGTLLLCNDSSFAPSLKEFLLAAVVVVSGFGIVHVSCAIFRAFFWVAS